MTFIIEDRVKETTTSTGAGNLTLAGALSTMWRACSAVCANNDTLPYLIEHTTLNEWEVGIGTWTTGNVLVRSTILESSNAGAAVNFSAGTKHVTLTIPAQLLKFLRPSAGVAGAGGAPFQFQTGVLTTAAELGAFEFDGKSFYLSHTAGDRAVVQIAHIVTNTADFGGGNVNTAQPFFEAARDTLTLENGQSYLFKGVINMARAAGTTSHTIDTLFGGTATFDDFNYWCQCRDGAASATTPLRPYVNHYSGTTPSSSITVTVAATTANSTTFHIEGMLRTAAAGGGTLIPQFKYSAAPGGAPTVKRSSFMMFIPIGANSFAHVGAFA